MLDHDVYKISASKTFSSKSQISASDLNEIFLLQKSLGFSHHTHNHDQHFAINCTICSNLQFHSLDGVSEQKTKRLCVKLQTFKDQ